MRPTEPTVVTLLVEDVFGAQDQMIDGDRRAFPLYGIGRFTEVVRAAERLCRRVRVGGLNGRTEAHDRAREQDRENHSSHHRTSFAPQSFQA